LFSGYNFGFKKSCEGAQNRRIFKKNPFEERRKGWDVKRWFLHGFAPPMTNSI
jgi:hypothetical protein